MTQIVPRLLLGCALVILSIVAIALSTTPVFFPIFAFGCAGAVALVLWEFYRLPMAKACDPLDKIGVVTGAAYILSLFVIHSFFWLPFLVLGVSLVWSFAAFFMKGSSPIINLSVTYFGLFYLALPLGFFVLISELPFDSRMWLYYALAVPKLTDVGAFFGGYFFGKHPLAPEISPNKTVEGALLGLLAATVTSLLFAPWLTLTPFQAILSGLLIGFFAQFGDAAESLLKRDAKIKDSGRLPGLGGLLDIMDSLVFSLPLVYITAKLMEPI